MVSSTRKNLTDEARFYKKSHKDKARRLRKFKDDVSLALLSIVMETTREFEAYFKEFTDRIDDEIEMNENKVSEYRDIIIREVPRLNNDVETMVRIHP